MNFGHKRPNAHEALQYSVYSYLITCPLKENMNVFSPIENIV